MDKEKRVASYPSHLDVNYWLDHPKEHGLAFSVTHYAKYICRKRD